MAYGDVRECVNCGKVTWATLDMKTREEGNIIIFCNKTRLMERGGCCVSREGVLSP